jgi:hypothetical protein
MTYHLLNMRRIRPEPNVLDRVAYALGPEVARPLLEAPDLLFQPSRNDIAQALLHCLHVVMRLQKHDMVASLEQPEMADVILVIEVSKLCCTVSMSSCACADSILF